MTKRGIDICVVFLLSGLLAIPMPSFAQYNDHRDKQVDSLEQVLATNPPTGADMVRVYRDLMWGYMQTDTEKSMGYARRCVDSAAALEGWFAVQDGHLVLAMNHYEAARYDSAMVYYNRSLEATDRMRKASKYTEGEIDDALSMIYGNMANLYNVQGMLHEAIDHYIRALRLFEKHEWNESRSIAHNNIGEIYMSMGNWEQAESHFLRSDSLAAVTGDKLMVAMAQHRMADLRLSTKDYDQALEYAGAARDYFFARPEEGNFQVATLNTLAQIYLDGYDDVAQAEEYVRQALQLTQTNEVMTVTQTATLGLLAEIHLRRSEWRAARQRALEALATDDSEPTNTLTIYGILAQANAYLGNADQSALYFNRHDSLQSSWATKHYQSAIRDMEVKYETEKIQTRVATLEDERRLMVWLGVAAGAVLLLALAALFFIWRWTAQRKRLAEQQIVQLEQEKRLVATQAVLDGEIAERTRLARDLHDGLGSILTGTKLNLQEMMNGAKMNTASREHYDTAMSLVNQSMSEMRRVAHHLMPEALAAAGLKQSISDFCRSVPGATFNWYGDEARFDPRLETVVYRIAHELVSNALRHSGAGHILVELVRYENTITLTVQDDGRGFDPASSSPGMGLANIRARVAAAGGNLMVDSKPGVGTEINVELLIDHEKF